MKNKSKANEPQLPKTIRIIGFVGGGVIALWLVLTTVARVVAPVLGVSDGLQSAVSSVALVCMIVAAGVLGATAVQVFRTKADDEPGS